MLTYILTHFPSHTHALTLVSDPDDLLADELVMATLRDRVEGATERLVGSVSKIQP